MALDDAALREAWTAYSRDADRAARQALIVHYLPFADRLAQAMSRRTPPSVEFGDLQSLAYMGLIKAIGRFKPDINESFELFSASFIRGHMLDELRARDRVSRPTRRSMRSIEGVRETIEATLSRPPTLEEISDETGMTTEDIRATMAKVDAARPVYIDESPTATPPALPPDATVPRLQVDTAHLIRSMDLTTQLILAKRYYDQMTLAAIATELGITQSVVSDLHARAVAAISALAEAHLEESEKPSRHG